MSMPALRSITAMVAVLGLSPLLWAQPTDDRNTEAPPVIVDLDDLRPPEREMLDDAIRLQQAKAWSQALLQLEELLRFHPDSKLRDETLFRIAASYRGLGRFDDARNSIRLLRERHPKSSWMTAAALLEGEMVAADGDWAAAAPLFESAAKSTDPDIRRRARYLAVIGAESRGDLAAARESMEALVKEGPEGPYYDFAMVKSGAVLAAGNKSDEAATRLRDVLARTDDHALRAEAGVRLGNLDYENKRWRDAIANYEIVRRVDAPPFWKRLAHLGLVQARFAAKDYAGVLDVYNETKPDFPDNARPQVLFYVAESYRLNNQTAEALDQYAFLLKEFSDTDLAEPAQWARILLLNKENSPDLLPETAAYISKFADGPRAFEVKLLRAEQLDARREHTQAARMYEAIAKEDGFAGRDHSIRLAVFLRWASAAFDAKEFAASRRAIDRLLKDNPPAERVADALWLRGQAELADGDPTAALATWQRWLRDFPEDARRQEVLWRAAMLAGHMQQWNRLEEGMKSYLDGFPKSPRIAEAAYWTAFALQEQDKEAQSAPYWKQARDNDPSRYFETATRQIIRLALQQKDVPALRAEVDAYDQWRIRNPAAPAVALEVYEWLGQELAGGEDPAAAEPFLRRVLAATRDRDQRRRANLALALLLGRLDNHGAAIREWRGFRASFPEDANRSAVLEPLARAHIGAAEFDDAQNLAEQILRQNPEGEWNARGRILLGDIAFARRRYDEAARIFSAAALLIDDPELTPQSVAKAERAYRRAGNDKEADARLLDLRKRFPDYRLKE